MFCNQGFSGLGEELLIGLITSVLSFFKGAGSSSALWIRCVSLKPVFGWTLFSVAESSLTWSTLGSCRSTIGVSIVLLTLLKAVSLEDLLGFKLRSMFWISVLLSLFEGSLFLIPVFSWSSLRVLENIPSFGRKDFWDLDSSVLCKPRRFWGSRDGGKAWRDFLNSLANFGKNLWCLNCILKECLFRTLHSIWWLYSKRELSLFSSWAITQSFLVNASWKFGWSSMALSSMLTASLTWPFNS